MRCLVVEDTVTTGGSTAKAIERIREEGLEVAGVVAVVDRLAGGAERIEAAAEAPYRPWSRSTRSTRTAPTGAEGAAASAAEPNRPRCASRRGSRRQLRPEVAAFTQQCGRVALSGIRKARDLAPPEAEGAAGQ